VICSDINTKFINISRTDRVNSYSNNNNSSSSEFDASSPTLEIESEDE
jgi:hypothetical protein